MNSKKFLMRTSAADGSAAVFPDLAIKIISTAAKIPIAAICHTFIVSFANLSTSPEVIPVISLSGFLLYPKYDIYISRIIPIGTTCDILTPAKVSTPSRYLL